MRWLAALLFLLLLWLQYRLWVGDDGLAEVQSIKTEIAVQQEELKQLRFRNQALEAEVQDLRDGLDALEERARSELGMIKRGEMFLQVIEAPQGEGAAAQTVPPGPDPPPAGEGGEQPPPGDRTSKKPREKDPKRP